jgi:hypothetical protein
MVEQADTEEDGTENHPICVDADDSHDRSAEPEPEENSTADQHMSNDRDDPPSGDEKSANDDDIAQSIPDIEADPEEYGTGDQDMSDNGDDLHEGDKKSDEVNPYRVWKRISKMIAPETNSCRTNHMMKVKILTKLSIDG